MSIQISGGGPNVADIQSGLATAAAVAALATSVAGREQQISVNAPNHIAVTADMTSATWNTVATHKVFAITGAVRMRMWIQSHSLASGTSEAYMSLLIGNAFEVFRAGKIENTNGFWVGQNAYQPIIASGNVFQDYVLAENVGYGVTVEPFKEDLIYKWNIRRFYNQLVFMQDMDVVKEKKQFEQLNKK